MLQNVSRSLLELRFEELNLIADPVYGLGIEAILRLAAGVPGKKTLEGAQRCDLEMRRKRLAGRRTHSAFPFNACSRSYSISLSSMSRFMDSPSDARARIASRSEIAFEIFPSTED